MVDSGLYAGGKMYDTFTRYLLISPVGNSYVQAQYVAGVGSLEFEVVLDDKEGVPDPADNGCALETDHCQAVWSELVTHGISASEGVSLELHVDEVDKAKALARVLHECGLGPFRSVNAYNDDNEACSILI